MRALVKNVFDGTILVSERDKTAYVFILVQSTKVCNPSAERGLIRADRDPKTRHPSPRARCSRVKKCAAKSGQQYSISIARTHVTMTEYSLCVKKRHLIHN